MPNFEYENNYQGLVAGIDEAGRGPWAGPVVAGAVVFLQTPIDDFLLHNLNDSKKLSAKKRETLYAKLLTEQELGRIALGIGQASSIEIDEKNILQATFLAMQRAVGALGAKPQLALIDGNQTPKNFSLPTQTLVKGDAKSLSIAAASIVAKVYRDKLMADLAKKYPFYAFEKNAGYGTAAHISGLQKYGITPEHRKSYKPIKLYL